MCEPFEPVHLDTVATRNPHTFLSQGVINRQTVELVGWIAEDRAGKANGRYVLRRWRESIEHRNAQQNRERDVPVPLPEIVQLPGVVHTYLAEIGVTAATRVKLNPDGGITEVLSKKGVRPRVCGTIICESQPVAV